jgi:glycosyltransferase involved in cell wall biosynthesis
MTFPNCFDAVIMLTWSDWKTEPRSNRYHYATRFARTVPVLFLQHQYLKRSKLSIETTEVPNVDIVNISIGLNDREVAEIKQLIHARGIRRPLVWIYDSMNYHPLLDAIPNAFRVYHATEDYLTKSNGWSGGWSSNRELVAKSVVRVLEEVDFLVACTEGVATSCLTSGNYRGQYAVIENGCDAEYFLEFAQRLGKANKAGKIPVAIFQGGINSRLDYPLMHALIQRMPAWEFRFCGHVAESDAWHRILKLPNVKYFGALKPEKFAQLMCESTVGIITYIQDQWIRNSLPLKAYEYVACGLPVVTVPIAALERDPDLMTIATTPEEFENALLAAAKTRFDPNLLKRRRDAALAKSYNVHFNSMCQFLREAATARGADQNGLKLAMLYDSVGFMKVSTSQKHLEAFRKYSNHLVTYVPATPTFWNFPPKEIQYSVDFSCFDVVVVHCSVRLSDKEHLDEGVAHKLESFNGLKVLLIQDEYVGREVSRQWMDRLQFDLVYTCVPDSGLEQIYPSYRFPSTEFFSVYIDEITKVLEDNDCLEINDYCSDKSSSLNNFSSRAFVERIEADFEQRVMVRKSASLLMGLFSVSIDGSIKQVLPLLPLGITTENHPLSHTVSAHEAIGNLLSTQSAKTGSPIGKTVLVEPKNATEFFHLIRRISSQILISICEKIFYCGKRALRWADAARERNPILQCLMLLCWKSLPPSFRIRFLQALREDQK